MVNQVGGLCQVQEFLVNYRPILHNKCLLIAVMYRDSITIVDKVIS